MHIGVTYDLRSDYRALGYSEEATAEFDVEETIAAVCAALNGLGHKAERIGGIRPLAAALVAGRRWDAVFNICEGLKGVSREAQVPALLEAFDIPYVFSDPLSLGLALDKAMAKRVVRDAGVPTADFTVIESEADIAKVQIGDPATTTLDAYGSDTFFPTKVIKIDPAETIIESVPTYKVTLAFASTTDSRIKSGMTANLDILAGQANNVLSIPARSVYAIDTQKYVQLVTDPKNPKDTTQTAVETGMRGVDGYVQILSGLKEGDVVIASPSI